MTVPDGWQQGLLDEINDPQRPICYGILMPGPDLIDGVPYVKVRNMRDERVLVDEVHRTSREIEARFARSRLRAGDLLVSIRGTYGRTASVPQELDGGNITQDTARIAPVGMYPPFVLRFLQSPQAQTYFKEVARGVAVKGVNIGDLRKLPVPVPPLAEQQRIVTAIEEAFSKLDAGEAGLRGVRQRLKRMRDAVLADAVSGRLVPQDPADTPAAKLLADLGVETLAIGGSSVLPASWARTTVGAIAVVGTGTTPSRSNPGYWAGGTIPWASSALLNDGSITSTSEFVTPAALRETSLRVWPAGTLLVAMYGEGRTRGKCAELGIDAACNQACAAISLRDGLTSMRRFLRLVFDASYQANRRLASGGVQPNLNLGLVRSIEVPLPPANEQQRIVTEVERQFSFIDACERAADTALARSAALRRSVLKAAFEGKLVAQDPADEPASVLLERIRGEHEAVGVAPKRPRRARAGPT